MGLIDNALVIGQRSVKRVRIVAKVDGQTVKEAVIRVKGGEATGLIDIMNLAAWPTAIDILFEDLGDE